MARYPERVTFLRAPLVSGPYGLSRDWSAATAVGGFMASVQPANSDANRYPDEGDRETAVTTYRVFVKGGAEVLASDRMVWGADTFDLVGPALLHRRQVAGRVVYTLLLARRVDG